MKGQGVTEKRTVRLMGVITGCTNPESAELLNDGETVVFGNCRLTAGLPFFRAGAGLVYIKDEAFTSRARISPDGDVELLERRVIGGLTATLGCDVLRVDTEAFPSGTVFQVAGGGPVTADCTSIVPHDPYVLIYDPLAGKILARLPLGPDSEIGKKYNGLEQPNGCAVDVHGNLYVSDIPNTNPDPDPAAPPPVPPAVYRIPVWALQALVDGVPGSADRVQRVPMPGYVNGVTVSPVDDTVWAVSCSPVDPVGGGLYQLTRDAFENEEQPPPVVQGLGILDGVGMTRRGTALVSLPREGEIIAFPSQGGGEPVVLTTDQPNPVRFPADFNVVYPRALDGEPALLVPDIGLGYEPGASTVAVLDISGL